MSASPRMKAVTALPFVGCWVRLTAAQVGPCTSINSKFTVPWGTPSINQLGPCSKGAPLSVTSTPGGHVVFVCEPDGIVSCPWGNAATPSGDITCVKLNIPISTCAVRGTVFHENNMYVVCESTPSFLQCAFNVQTGQFSSPPSCNDLSVAQPCVAPQRPRDVAISGAAQLLVSCDDLVWPQQRTLWECTLNNSALPSITGCADASMAPPPATASCLPEDISSHGDSPSRIFTSACGTDVGFRHCDWDAATKQLVCTSSAAPTLPCAQPLALTPQAGDPGKLIVSCPLPPSPQNQTQLAVCDWTSSPTLQPTEAPGPPPSVRPTQAPSLQPWLPSLAPAGSSPSPTGAPVLLPSRATPPSQPPTGPPTPWPTSAPSGYPVPNGVPPPPPPSWQQSTSPTGTPTSPSVAPANPSTPTQTPSALPATSSPSMSPASPTSQATGSPTQAPSSTPISAPTTPPPSVSLLAGPTAPPFAPPTRMPVAPTTHPSGQGSSAPTTPSVSPLAGPTAFPSAPPTRTSVAPTTQPSGQPSGSPLQSPPSDAPTARPSPRSSSPTAPPTSRPSAEPSVSPKTRPSGSPTPAPSAPPIALPTTSPSVRPSSAPARPTTGPTAAPAVPPTKAPVAPTERPQSQASASPIQRPSPAPTAEPSGLPAGTPTIAPTVDPSPSPLGPPSAPSPSTGPSRAPSAAPSRAPASSPTGPPQPPSAAPAKSPTTGPSASPTPQPKGPTSPPSGPPGSPSAAPSASPSLPPSSPTTVPVLGPSQSPSAQPATLPPSSPTSTVPSSTPFSSTAPAENATWVPAGPTVSPTPPSASPSAVPLASPSGSSSATPSAAPSLVKAKPATIIESDTTTVATVVPAALVAGCAVQLGTLLMATEVQCNTLGTFQDVPRSLHPLGFEVGDNIYLGCLCGAAILASGAALLSFAALGALKLVDENGDGMLGKEEIQGSCLKYIPVIKDSEAIDLAAVVRHPNTILLTVLLLYQGAAFSSLRLLIAHQDRAGNEVEPWMRSLGAIVALALLLFPIKLYRVIKDGLTAKERQDLPGKGPEVRARVRQWDDPDPPSRWVQYVLLSEHGDWVSCRRRKHWINQWQSAVRPFTEACATWGTAAELVAMWALALANSLHTPTLRACGHVRMIAAAVHLAQLVFCVVVRPYRCLRDTVLKAVSLGLLTVALILVGLSHYSAADEQERSGGAEVRAHAGTAEGLYTAVIVFVLLQVATRGAAELVLLAKGWRANSQQLEWDAAEGAAGREAERGAAPEPKRRSPEGQLLTEIPVCNATPATPDVFGDPPELALRALTSSGARPPARLARGPLSPVSASESQSGPGAQWRRRRPAPLRPLHGSGHTERGRKGTAPVAAGGTARHPGRSLRHNRSSPPASPTGSIPCSFSVSYSPVRDAEAAAAGTLDGRRSSGSSAQGLAHLNGSPGEHHPLNAQDFSCSGHSASPALSHLQIKSPRHRARRPRPGTAGSGSPSGAVLTPLKALV
eukprot:TRINITY_DN4513_c1_g1_i6.p1 TRINITY_DN4513_c1_g1~~TRINITY_DN4513_c1_g1_i6.p1  ORF type:complete len:1507 (+),score=169.55 TRINITY_DN4513_c1_g1_i6:68-4522(+)